MQRHKFTKDLLSEWARQHEASYRRKRIAGVVLASAVVVGGLLELGLAGTPYVFSFALGALLVLLLIAVGIGYSGFVFFVAWSYAKWCREKGQVRPSIIQMLGIVVVSALGALPVAAFTIRDDVDSRFWVALGFLLWNNASAATLGYLSKFLLQSR